MFSCTSCLSLLIHRGTSGCQASAQCSCSIRTVSALKSLGVSETHCWWDLWVGFRRAHYILIQGFNCSHSSMRIAPRISTFSPEGGSWDLQLTWTPMMYFRVVGLHCVYWPFHFLHWAESYRKKYLHFYQFNNLNVHLPNSTPKCVFSGVCFWKLIPGIQIWWSSGYRHTQTYSSPSMPFTKTFVASKSVSAFTFLEVLCPFVLL